MSYRDGLKFSYTKIDALFSQATYSFSLDKLNR
ncbi:Uncharacterised protein [Legionella busanensis]|uniref:Uncharacterized protein n=1 Tax=Legionella busanensis TaxID=190655 RepID=A0A378JKB1_9GAMM|nr:Uncharacterised protein [Legionella busanensis]